MRLQTVLGLRANKKCSPTPVAREALDRSQSFCLGTAVIPALRADWPITHMRIGLFIGMQGPAEKELLPRTIWPLQNPEGFARGFQAQKSQIPDEEWSATCGWSAEPCMSSTGCSETCTYFAAGLRTRFVQKANPMVVKSSASAMFIE